MTRGAMVLISRPPWNLRESAKSADTSYSLAFVSTQIDVRFDNY